MTLTLTRQQFLECGIFSLLKDEDGNIIAHTLEHSYDCKPKVYDGTFTCVRGIHHLDHIPVVETFEVIGVTGHEGILFHVGNYNKDSDGCILLGTGVAMLDDGSQMITDSKVAFDKFMALLTGIESFSLVVES